jgi:Domain of unknown function (DUF1932)
MGWAALAENSAERVSSHGIRRAAEMREAAEMIADMGLSPALARHCRRTGTRREGRGGQQSRRGLGLLMTAASS